MSSRTPQTAVQPLGFTQIPGAAVFIAASPDGSVWVLSTQGVSTGDKYIYHYQNGTWTNVPGALNRIAVAPDGSLWGVNVAGGIYHYVGGYFLPIAGGASDLSVGADGSLYVISNVYGGQYGNGIYHYTNGTWTQLPGAGTRIATSWDTGNYSYNVAPGGFYIVNAQLSLFYYNPSLGFAQIPGAAIQLAPTVNGGLFVLGVPNSPVGNPIYYNDLSSGTWTQQNGAGVAIATNSTAVWVIGANNGIYYSPVTQSNPVGTGAVLTGPTYGPSTNLWAARGVADALKYPVQNGFNGAGQSVAIIIDSNYYQTDLSRYLTANQTPSTGRSVSVQLVDGASSTPTAGNFEASLDLETIAGLAPGANVTLYVVPSLTTIHLNNAINAIINAGQAKVVSMSYGGCEYSSEVSGQGVLYQSGANAGIAFIASSGDQGNQCYNGLVNNQATYAVGVNYPAADANVIAVGGTQTYTANAPTSSNSLLSTSVWNDTTFSGTGAQFVSGGGYSRYVALPAYQSGAGGFSPQFKNVPDIAMPAIGTYVYDGAQTMPDGGQGTSWSAPLFAAMLAEVYQYCGTSFTNAASIPYYVYTQAGHNAFLDITSGNNEYQGAGSYFLAQPGYDNVTGLGVPFGMPFANTICPNRVPASFMRVNASAVSQAGRRSATAVRLEAAPSVRGLVDIGRRSAESMTDIQLILQPGSTIASDEQTVISILQTAGFQITQTFGNHLIVDAEAPNSAVEQLFSTQIHDETQGRYGTRYTPVSAVTLPASLAPYVSSVSLDNVVTAAHR